MATDRGARFAVPAAAAFLLWPAVWNGFPIVFADTATYLTQAIHHYAGWDRPVFYSLFMLPLHATVTLWPVVVVQALLAAWVLRLVCRALLPSLSALAFVGGVFGLSICTWLPWLVCELMPDLFTPLLVLVLCLLAAVPERLSPPHRVTLVALATFLIATQQSSLPLACVLGTALIVLNRPWPSLFPTSWPNFLPTSWSAFPFVSWPNFLPTSWSAFLPTPRPAFPFVSWPGLARPPTTLPLPPPQAERDRASPTLSPALQPTLPPASRPASHSASRPRSARPPTTSSTTQSKHKPRHPWLLIAIPPALALLALCTVNLAAHGRFAASPYGNVFLLARVIYDGPGMAVLRRDCPAAHWLLCPRLDQFPPTSDDFLWSPDSPLKSVGGPKIVSAEASAIIRTALQADPIGEAKAVLTNTLQQLTLFASGDGLNPWPDQVSPVIQHDFPAREQAAYATARQQTGSLSIPPILAQIHTITALTGVLACALLLPIALKRRAPCAGFLLAVLLVLPLSAAITGGLSAPHDRYQARIMWLPPFIASVSFAALRRRPQ
jgi:hypothetical protein